MNKLIITLAILVTLFSGAVNADENAPLITIKEIATGWGNEGIYIVPNETITPVDGCEVSRFIIKSDHQWLEKLLSIGLSAFHSQSKVRIRVSGCRGTHMVVKAISLVKS